MTLCPVDPSRFATTARPLPVTPALPSPLPAAPRRGGGRGGGRRRGWGRPAGGGAPGPAGPSGREEDPCDDPPVVPIDRTIGATGNGAVRGGSIGAGPALGGTASAGAAACDDRSYAEVVIGGSPGVGHTVTYVRGGGGVPSRGGDVVPRPVAGDVSDWVGASGAGGAAGVGASGAVDRGGAGGAGGRGRGCGWGGGHGRGTVPTPRSDVPAHPLSDMTDGGGDLPRPSGRPGGAAAAGDRPGRGDHVNVTPCPP